MDLGLDIANDIIESKIYDKQYNFNSEIVKDLGQS